MAETLVLDPGAVATSRTAVDITPWMTDEGVDWGDGAIEAYLADGAIGASPVDYRLPNRQISVPMKLMARGTVTFETIRRQLQSKVALFQKEGGWISRVTPAGGTVFADVVNASLVLGGDWMQANTTAAQRADVRVELKMEVSPDFYGSEITLDDKTETTLPVLTTVLKQSAADAVISGDYPGRVRIVVDEDDSDKQLGLMWGFRSRYYDSASTAALFYQAEALTPLDVAANFALAGASGGTVVRHNSLAANWTPVLSTQILSGGAHMTHRGSYRVWARCYSTVFGSSPSVRLVWDVGDLTYPAENAPVTVPDLASFYLVNLGTIRLDAPPVGTHRWIGMIQAKAEASNSNIHIDAIMFQPIDDGAGWITAPISPGQGLSTYAARDEYNQSAGTATGKVLQVGGTYSGAGDADDFSIDATAHTLTRASINDAGNVGRQLIAGTATFTNVRVRVDAKHSAVHASVPPAAPGKQVMARWVDSANFAMAGLYDTTVNVVTRIASATNQLQSVSITDIGLDLFETITFGLDTEGRYFVWVGAIAEPIISGQDAVFATGGALASGRIGIYDLYEQATASTRTYDNFAAWVPTSEAAIHASQSGEIRTDGVFREDAAGVAWGPAGEVAGALPRIPSSGLETRKVELFIKGSRGNFDRIPDSGIDDISAQAFYRPSWLFLS